MSERMIRTTDDLPISFPVFPLPGTLLFPRGILPLNIFEPRYLNMVDDARAGDGVIAMVQSLPSGPKSHPDIAEVGCLGRLVDFSETSDGRYIIALEGIARFRILDELPFDRPYREVRVDWSEFEEDLSLPDLTGIPDREVILDALRDYLNRHGLEANWEAAQTAPPESFINALCASCPFSIMEKQALLETPDLKSRCHTLIALFEMDSFNEGGSSRPQ